MTNPFDAATPNLIACYEDNYLHGFVKPRYSVPAIRYNVLYDPALLDTENDGVLIVERIRPTLRNPLGIGTVVRYG